MIKQLRVIPYVSIFVLLLMAGVLALGDDIKSEKFAIRLEFSDPQSLQEFLEDTSAYEQKISEWFGSPADFLMTSLQVKKLRESGKSYTLLPSEHLAFALNSFTGTSANPPPYTNYTRATLEAELQNLAASYPNISTLSIMGYSTEGRPIYMMKVSDNVGQKEDEPRVIFHGVHHAKECIGADCCMTILHYLLDGYNVDPVATAHVNDCEIYVIPLANPDGWDKIETGVVSGWRKNTRDNNKNGIFDPGYDGVDLNRNMSFNWGMAGSSNPSSSTYYGPGPLSEPENQPLAHLGVSERFALGLTFHMSGDMVILPWKWNGPTPDHPTYLEIGALLSKKLGYALVQWIDTGGYFTDHFYGWRGTMAYTIEITSANNPTSITNNANHNLKGAKRLLKRVKEGQITGIVTNAKTGLPMSAKIELREIDTSYLPDRTSDPEFGRYRWMLKDGAYMLKVSSSQGFQSKSFPNLQVTGAPVIQDVALTPLDAWIDGYPQLGQTIALNLDSPAGQGFFQFIGLASANLLVPPYSGALQVDPTNLIILASGVMGPLGSLSLPLTIPNNPSFIGIEVFYQCLAGLTGGSGTFTNLASMTLLE